MELVLVTPLLVLLLLISVGLGRLADARLRVDDAAHQAARAASLARTDAAAQTDARTAAGAALAADGASCTSAEVDVATAGLRLGAVARARVICTVSLADLVGLPGQVQVTSEARSPIDVYRGDAG
ncbi:TadE/TadG family type IV pilus assembly protein [Streptomyces sp. N35]|uniref:TadE/TadG family type IV pilus assembly protein n=1 Tax=Streptomyces sp. N35 TaxID=2795730 RepID=UPI0018F6CDDD|nr:TadE/TadG family type IV pilus assembly protein [Streptomyces sp. N35]